MERLVITPQSVFKDKWPGWGTFLGTGKTRSGYRRSEFWISMAKQIESENGGFLDMELCRASEPALYCYISKNKSMFSDVNLKYAFKSIKERVKEAECLAKSNGGKLPRVGWMQKNEPGLYECIRSHPGSFSHVPREQGKYRTIGEWVLFAADLAKNNGGVLPCSSVLQKTGLGGLDQAMRKNRGAFNGIEQEVRDGRYREAV